MGWLQVNRVENSRSEGVIHHNVQAATVDLINGRAPQGDIGKMSVQRGKIQG